MTLLDMKDYRIDEEKLEVYEHCNIGENSYIAKVVTTIPKEAFIEAYEKWILGKEN